ncbi:heavy-metal-associated domain-containing protein [Craurococcus roseus]|uniref:Heavy-metal-associated domain-containing protein n=1 Tax=Craurococcus roseus TaxID=77585 RepID=A0ABN1FK21_9PROT
MLRFKVANMSCGGCARAVTAALRGVDPAARIAVDLERREVAVEGTAGAEGFAGALREAGFEGQALPA